MAKREGFVIHSLGNVLVGLELYLDMTLLPSRNGKACGEPAAARPGAGLGRPVELSCSSATTSPPAHSQGRECPSPRLIRDPGRFGAQGSRFPPSVAADLDSGADSAPDPISDEEQEEDEQDLRLPGAVPAVEELPGLSGQGRMGAEGVWDGAAPPRTGCSPARCSQVLLQRRCGTVAPPWTPPRAPLLSLSPVPQS